MKTIKSEKSKPSKSPLAARSFLPIVTKAQFDRMKPENQRVAIAKDVLARLDSKQLKVTPGTWVKVKGFKGAFTNNGNLRDNPDPIDLKTLVNAGRKCEVCALGAVMCSIAGIKNSLEVEDATEEGTENSYDDAGHVDLDNHLVRSVFGDAYVEIEYCFEEGYGAFEWIRDDKRRERLDAFIRQYPSAKKRFRAIFTDIIQNKGSFLP